MWDTQNQQLSQATQHEMSTRWYHAARSYVSPRFQPEIDNGETNPSHREQRDHSIIESPSPHHTPRGHQAHVRMSIQAILNDPYAAYKAGLEWIMGRTPPPFEHIVPETDTNTTDAAPVRAQSEEPGFKDIPRADSPEFVKLEDDEGPPRKKQRTTEPTLRKREASMIFEPPSREGEASVVWENYAANLTWLHEMQTRLGLQSLPSQSDGEMN